MKSYRVERMEELTDGMKRRHALAGKFITVKVQKHTPIGTPQTTGDPNYPVTMALFRSIEWRATEDHVDIGTKKPYAPYVHQGTYDFAHGRQGWNEATAREAEAIFQHNRGDISGRKGAMPRPFLVNGLIDSRAFLHPIYNKQIVGGR
jgi:hypothetical protein